MPKITKKEVFELAESISEEKINFFTKVAQNDMDEIAFALKGNKFREVIILLAKVNFSMYITGYVEGMGMDLPDITEKDLRTASLDLQEFRNNKKKGKTNEN